MSRLITDLRYILLVGFLIRVLFAFTYDTGDTGAFCQASQFFLENKEVYANPAVFYSGPPFALHVTALSHFLADTFHLPCSGMWKMPTVFADIGIGYLIFRIERNHLNCQRQKNCL